MHVKTPWVKLSLHKLKMMGFCEALWLYMTKKGERTAEHTYISSSNTRHDICFDFSLTILTQESVLGNSMCHYNVIATCGHSGRCSAKKKR